MSNGTVPTAVGTGTGSTSISPDLPTGRSDRDLLVMFVATKPDTATIDTPTDWTAPTNGAGSGGGGTTGADTGPTNCAVFYRVVDGLEVAPTVSVTSGNSSWALIFNYRSSYSPNVTWDVAAANGTDITTGAAWSVTMGTDPGLGAGDEVIVGSSIPTDVSTPAQFTVVGLSATGCTFNATCMAIEPETTTGNDMGGFITRATVLTGPSSAAAVYTATASGTTTNVRGVSVLCRLRDTQAVPGSSLQAARQPMVRSYYW